MSIKSEKFFIREENFKTFFPKSIGVKFKKVLDPFYVKIFLLLKNRFFKIAFSWNLN